MTPCEKAMTLAGYATHPAEGTPLLEQYATGLAAPLAWIYELVVRIRHKLFDLNILKSEEFDIPIVCVGNLTVGGTGKTPVTEYLIEKLSPIFKVAVLSRGYKRKTRGFVLSTVQSSFRSIGDEPKQIKLKYPEIP